MSITNLNPDLLVVCHCYSGDKQQVLDLLPVLEHHEAPIVIISPDDAPVHGIGPHICRTAGQVAYIGQKSWDRQYAQLKVLLEYPQKWFLLNDSDSFCLTPKLPSYLFRNKHTVFSNQVRDFRVDMPEFGPSFHDPYPKIAMQPPYFLSREALIQIVAKTEGMVACPTTPFIDWWWIPAVYHAGLAHLPYDHCASCETVTPNGVAVMSQCVADRGATFIHSIKSGDVMRKLVALHNKNYG